MTLDKVAWSHYWANAPSGARGCLPGLPADVVAVFEARWKAFFKRLPHGARVLDLGTGHGAVLRLARQVRSDLVLLGVDYAENAPDDTPGIEFRSDVDFELLPFQDQEFDAVCSQFALEYAGAQAAVEVLRVLRPSGALMVVAHHAGSLILAQNRRRLAALDALMADGGLLSAAQEAVRQGTASHRSVTQAMAAMLPELRRTHAGQIVVEEIAQLAARLMNQPGAIEKLQGLRSGAAMEQLRLRALARAALDEPSAMALAGALSQAQRIVRCEAFSPPGAAQPIAWHIEA